MLHKINFAALILVFLANTAFCADQPAMPMITKPPVSKPAVKPKIDKEQIFISFKKAYQRAGEPRIAIFWNRKFDDQLSQWEATSRRNVDEEIIEVRANNQNRRGLGEEIDFEFGAGFSTAFINTQAQIIDRQAIMRLIERQNSKEAGRESVADYQKVETDALIGHADYITEIVFISDSSSDLGMGFLVSVKEVKTGRVLTMFRSSAIVPVQGDMKPYWVATANGYEKVYRKRPAVPANKVGEQLAVETMAALNKLW